MTALPTEKTLVALLTKHAAFPDMDKMEWAKMSQGHWEKFAANLIWIVEEINNLSKGKMTECDQRISFKFELQVENMLDNVVFEFKHKIKYKFHTTKDSFWVTIFFGDKSIDIGK